MYMDCDIKLLSLSSYKKNTCIEKTQKNKQIIFNFKLTGSLNLNPDSSMLFSFWFQDCHHELHTGKTSTSLLLLPCSLPKNRNKTAVLLVLLLTAALKLPVKLVQGYCISNLLGSSPENFKISMDQDHMQPYKILNHLKPYGENSKPSVNPYLGLKCQFAAQSGPLHKQQSSTQYVVCITWDIQLLLRYIMPAFLLGGYCAKIVFLKIWPRS